MFTHAYAPPVPPSVPSVPSAPLPPAPLAPVPTFKAPRRLTGPTNAPRRLYEVPAPTFNKPRSLVEPASTSRRLYEQEDPFKSSALSAKIAKQFGSYPSGRESLQEEEYTYTKPETFKAPPFQKSSDLASQVDYEKPMVFNDPHYSSAIQTFGDTDQAGTRSAFNMSSDTWTITPEGDEPPLEPPEPVISTAGIEKIFEEAAAQFDQPAEEELLMPPPPPLEPVKLTGKYVITKTAEGRPTSNASMIAEINTAIVKGLFDPKTYISPSNTYQTGKNKGQIRNNVTTSQLIEMYDVVRPL